MDVNEGVGRWKEEGARGRGRNFVVVNGLLVVLVISSSFTRLNFLTSLFFLPLELRILSTDLSFLLSSCFMNPS